jgi:hypothetical protein
MLLDIRERATAAAAGVTPHMHLSPSQSTADMLQPQQLALPQLSSMVGKGMAACLQHITIHSYPQAMQDRQLYGYVCWIMMAFIPPPLTASPTPSLTLRLQDSAAITVAGVVRAKTVAKRRVRGHRQTQSHSELQGHDGYHTKMSNIF